MRLLRTLLLFCLFLNASAALPQATSRLDEIIARGSLRVGTTGDYKPFSYREGERFVGADIELAGQLAKALGVRLELVPTSWPTLMKDFADNRFDIAMSGVSVNLDRQKTALFSVPYLRDGKTPITRCENQARFQTLEQIDQPGVRAIVNPGGTNERFARAHLKRAAIAVYPDNVTIFDRIVAGEADLMITDAIETRLQQKLHPELCAVHPEAPFDYSEKAYLLPRDFLFKAYVDQWLHQTLASGALQKLLDRWIAYPWPQPDAVALAELGRLLEARLALMAEVAKTKWNSGAAIEDRAREEEIIRGLARLAEEAGLPSAWAQSFFRAQIEAAKTVQRDLFARWEREKAGKFDAVQDLVRDIRPQLDGLTPRILKALAGSWPALKEAKRRDEVARAMAPLREKLLPAAADQATAPLLDGSAARRP